MDPCGALCASAGLGGPLDRKIILFCSCFFSRLCFSRWFFKMATPRREGGPTEKSREVGIRGDLRNPDTLKEWRIHARVGGIAGMGGGAPCETWSAARYPDIEDGKAPPPLRSREDPWGVRSLSDSKQEQVDCANDLLGAALLLFTDLAIAGGVGYLEHPEEPAWIPHAPSIWRSDLARRLAETPISSTHSFDQRGIWNCGQGTQYSVAIKNAPGETSSQRHRRRRSLGKGRVSSFGRKEPR